MVVAGVLGTLGVALAAVAYVRWVRTQSLATATRRVSDRATTFRGDLVAWRTRQVEAAGQLGALIGALDSTRAVAGVLERLLAARSDSAETRLADPLGSGLRPAAAAVVRRALATDSAAARFGEAADGRRVLDIAVPVGDASRVSALYRAEPMPRAPFDNASLTFGTAVVQRLGDSVLVLAYDYQGRQLPPAVLLLADAPPRMRAALRPGIATGTSGGREPIRWAAGGATDAGWGVFVRFADAELLADVAAARHRATALAAAALLFILVGALAVDRGLRARRLRRLAESRAQLAHVIATARDAILTVDGEGIVRLANESAGALLRFDAARMTGEPIVRFVAADPPDALAPLLRPDGVERRLEFGPEDGVRGLRVDGTSFPLEGTATSTRFAGEPLTTFIVRDGSEHRRVEARLREAQRMEALSHLTGGLAHDFNNISTVLTAATDALLEDAHGGAAASRPLVEEIRRAASRGTALVNQLLSFGRRQVLRPEAVDVNALLVGFRRTARQIVGPEIELSLELAPAPPHAWVDPASIQQALVHLVLNARDAMPDGGRLRLASFHRDDDGGASVGIAVRDDGVGMSDAVRERVFEPFFTTKERASASGLGLSTIHGIVHQNGGEIRIESAVGRGTTVRVAFPAAGRPRDEPAPAGERRPPRSQRPPPGEPPQRRRPTGEVDLPGAPDAPTPITTVLFVDDEGGIRRLMSAALRRLGYRVLLAADGVEALACAAEADGGIDILVTDVEMPRVGGAELARRLTAERPSLPVLFISGYAEDQRVRDELGRTPHAFLRKPFDLHELVRAVRDLLDRGAAERG